MWESWTVGKSLEEIIICLSAQVTVIILLVLWFVKDLVLWVKEKFFPSHEFDADYKIMMLENRIDDLEKDMGPIEK